MSAAAVAAIKAALLALTDERSRKKAGWALTAILAPVILVIALLCSLGAGGAEHNNAVVRACFYGASYTENVPVEFRAHITQMQDVFELYPLSRTF